MKIEAMMSLFRKGVPYRRRAWDPETPSVRLASGEPPTPHETCRFNLGAEDIVADDWVMDLPKTFLFARAMELLVAGVAVRRGHWDSAEYIYVLPSGNGPHQDQLLGHTRSRPDGAPYNPKLSDLKATNWEVADAP